MRTLRDLILRHVDGAGPAPYGIMLSRVDHPSAPTSSIADPVLAVVAQGAKRLTLGDRIHDYGAGQYLVVSVDLPVTGHYTRASPEEPFLAFGLTLRPPDIASLLLAEAGAGTGAGAAPGTGAAAGPGAGTGTGAGERAGAEAARTGAAGRTGTRPPRPPSSRPPRPPSSRTAPPGLAVSDASPDLLDAVVRLVRLLDRPADLPILAPMIEREILWRLVTGEQGALVRQIGLADSRLRHISRAVRWIREHHAQTLRVEDLARLAGMSASPFHRHFRAVTAMTPIQFQKRIRLQEARLRLMSSTDDVAGVGFAVGYDSASQFSREYRRQFGSPPGQDAARLRGQAATGTGRSERRDDVRSPSL
ncbi:AraC family transcriptional regulator [Streptomyces sp. NBC_01558]|uniref:AraC family transcriptional regulator n=1 Tax=unclassified Streptomyces TaxID=2593676 RepID=UPI001EF3B928|nr:MULTISPECIES: AraC family transcriptional regulator [unclassified Streptomyces]WSD81824.1 AraC family transcriptional regulator [Streptomyces sp. NBC_01558]